MTHVGHLPSQGCRVQSVGKMGDILAYLGMFHNFFLSWTSDSPCNDDTGRALGRVMLSSGDDSMGSACITASQEKSRFYMLVRNNLPKGNI